jgi:hypothetical protein
MRFLLLSIYLFFSFTALADSVISSQVRDVDMGAAGEEPLVFLANGQVISYQSTDKIIHDQVKKAMSRKDTFAFTLNSERQIIEMNLIAKNYAPISNKGRNLFLEEEMPYQPSILKDMDQARFFFYEARPTHKESQCFNRAHVWTYEWRTKKNLYSSKVWLFFTRKFIRKYKFEWWFHVAPMVHVIADGAVKERVMDIKYARGPLKLKQWTDIFMRDNSDCPVVQKYSDHANFPEAGSCFVMKSSMYYYQPVDLEQSELLGPGKSRWLEPEVSNAYLEAFDEKIPGAQSEI